MIERTTITQLVMWLLGIALVGPLSSCMSVDPQEDHVPSADDEDGQAGDNSDTHEIDVDHDPGGTENPASEADDDDPEASEEEPEEQEDPDETVDAGTLEEPELPDGAGELTCFAPDREDYVAEHGPDPQDELANVDQGKEHTVLFIFDRSGSMGGPWESGSKWDVANDAMTYAVSEYQHYVSAGTIFFPTNGGCGVGSITSDAQIAIQEGGDFLDAWDDLIDGYGAEGSTPMVSAFERAHEAILYACAAGVLERPFKVVVLSDGAPNCNYNGEHLLIDYPAVWRYHGIETHVFGLPGSQGAANLLDAIANGGGTEESEDQEDEDDFEDDMGEACE